MKFKKTKKGNIIVPIIKGHLVIPISKRKYELFSNYELDLKKEDFEKVEGIWNTVFKKLYNNKITKQEWVLFNFYLPDVIYKKFKKNEPDLFKETDFMKICMMNIFKDYPKKREATINISLDLLKEYKKG